MRKTKANDNLYVFSKKTPWRFIAVVLLYAIGAASFPTKIFYSVLGESRSAVCFSAFLARAICCAVPVWLLCEIEAERLFSFKGFFKSLLPTLPFYIVALNNFPFLPLFSGNAAWVTGGSDEFVLSICSYFLMCAGISVLEETVFRGAILITLLRKFCKTSDGEKERKKGEFAAIIVSSALFGAAHLVNLFAGASVGATLLQVGYSFLIGCMCSFAMLKGNCFYHAIFLHAIFDFGGLLLENKLIDGVIWTTANVVLTAVVGAAVFVYAVILFFRGKNSSLVSEFVLQSEKRDFLNDERSENDKK